MAFRKTAGNLPVRNNARNGGYHVSVIGLLIISVVAPLLILATMTTSFLSTGIASTLIVWQIFGWVFLVGTYKVRISVVNNLFQLLSLSILLHLGRKTDLVI